ncbi:ionotropic receptor 31a isoform X2 [Musca autumnalis]|uniref:ionotropic receptor 31a isoform X2 n=1 Tax=Musca autumnalis TaxID=221902 RepID=UPI003CF6B622
MVTGTYIYTSYYIFRMRRSTEVGLDKRLLKQRQPEKPPCSNLYTVYPVDLSGTTSAFVFLAGCIILSIICCCLEVLHEAYFIRLSNSLLL